VGGYLDFQDKVATGARSHPTNAVPGSYVSSGLSFAGFAGFAGWG
jgi:hypothetical protein